MGGEALPPLILQSEQPSRQFADRCLGLPPFSQVPRDLCETGEFARVIAHGGDDDVRPESRAVFAHAPTLIFRPPFHLCLTGAAPLDARVVGLRLCRTVPLVG